MRFNSLKKIIYFLSGSPLKLIDTTFIDAVFDKEQKQHQGIINNLLQYTSKSVEVLAEHERAFPGDMNFLQSGYYKTMLKRYLFAGAFFCKEKRVLDSCCGLGWGTYLLAQYAHDILAFDIENKAVEFCQQTWKTLNVRWRQGDTLYIEDIVKSERFDVACAMETIEHFTREDGEPYIAELANVLSENGILIGTSAFPSDRKRADELCAQNPFHLYIFTVKEITTLLKKYFSEVIIINNWMFIARK